MRLRLLLRSKRRSSVRLALLRSDLDLEVIHLSMGGYDTHANQGGQHNGLLAQLGNNLRSFQDQLERAGLGDRVVTCVFSEFGRRATENLSGGTDHGSAYPAFVIGKGVKPGMHGEYPSLEDLDRGIERIVLTAVRKHPDNRYPTMSAMVKDIERAMGVRHGEPRGVALTVLDDRYEPESEGGRGLMKTLARDLR